MPRFRSTFPAGEIAVTRWLRSVPYRLPSGPIARFQRAALLAADGTHAPILPLGRVLAPDVPLFEEEFIREGVCIQRLYRLARWTDGSTHLWLARRKTTGATAGASGLAFDQIAPT